MQKLNKTGVALLVTSICLPNIHAGTNTALNNFIKQELQSSLSGKPIGNGGQLYQRYQNAAESSKLSGDEDSSCGAILCLAGGGGGGCSSYLRKYFRIKPHKRPGFLNICPQSEDPPVQQSRNNRGENQVSIGNGSRSSVQNILDNADKMKVSCDADEIYGLNSAKNFMQSKENFLFYKVVPKYDGNGNHSKDELVVENHSQNVYRQNNQIPEVCNSIVDYNEVTKPIYTCDANTEWFSANNWTYGTAETKIVPVNENSQFLADKNIHRTVTGKELIHYQGDRIVKMFDTSDVFILDGKPLVDVKAINNPWLINSQYGNTTFAIISHFPRTHCWVDTNNIEMDFDMDNANLMIDSAHDRNSDIRKIMLNKMYEAENGIGAKSTADAKRNYYTQANQANQAEMKVLNDNMRIIQQNAQNIIDNSIKNATAPQQLNATEQKYALQSLEEQAKLNQKTMALTQKYEAQGLKGQDLSNAVQAELYKETQRETKRQFYWGLPSDEVNAQQTQENPNGTYAWGVATNFNDNIVRTATPNQPSQPQPTFPKTTDANDIKQASYLAVQNAKNGTTSTAKTFDYNSSKAYQNTTNTLNKNMATFNQYADSVGQNAFQQALNEKPMSNEDIQKALNGQDGSVANAVKAVSNKMNEQFEQEKREANQYVKEKRIRKINEAIEQNKKYDAIPKEDNINRLVYQQSLFSQSKASLKSYVQNIEPYELNSEAKLKRNDLVKASDARKLLWNKFRDGDYHPNHTFDVFEIR